MLVRESSSTVSTQTRAGPKRLAKVLCALVQTILREMNEEHKTEVKTVKTQKTLLSLIRQDEQERGEEVLTAVVLWA